MSQVYVKEPPTFGRALYDYSLPWKTPQTLNQYLMTQRVPCTVTYVGNDGDYYLHLVYVASWELQPSPSVLKPFAQPNGSTGLFTNNGDIWPQHFDETIFNRGIEFRGLPASNNEFGVNAVIHHIDDMTAKSPIALFYPATGFQHPEGGPPGWNIWGIPVSTPNWFYYYNQAFPAPPGCTIEYNDRDTSFYQPLIPILNIGNNAHKPRWVQTFSKVNDVLKETGAEGSIGIDTYARDVTHEHTHLLCNEAIRDGAEDTDNDQVPDDWERRVGLIVGSKDSADFVNPASQVEMPYREEEGDKEVYARMKEEGVQGNITADWADDGLNWSRSAPPNPKVRNPRTPV